MVYFDGGNELQRIAKQYGMTPEFLADLTEAKPTFVGALLRGGKVAKSRDVQKAQEILNMARRVRRAADELQIPVRALKFEHAPTWRHLLRKFDEVYGRATEAVVVKKQKLSTDVLSDEKVAVDELA